MTEPTPDDRHDDSLEAIDAAEERTVARLYAERPVPAPAFRGELRRRLVSGSNTGARTWFGDFSARALVASYLGAGLIMLAVAAAGLVGAGPFGT
jgi:hypothetical protein